MESEDTRAIMIQHEDSTHGQFHLTRRLLCRKFCAAQNLSKRNENDHKIAQDSRNFICNQRKTIRLPANRKSLSIDMIPWEQHGFISARGTTSNLMELTEYLHMQLKLKNQVDVIYFDFTKAFDRIDHQLLALKLSSLTIHCT